MDDKLKETIVKIKRLAEQNPEFNEEMRKIFGGMSPAISVSDEAKITNIEHYLGLDFSVDTKDSIIDYTFIEDDKVLFQLVSDNREMMRFRYGTRFHKIDFAEFCKYAQFQAEMLLNYYYTKRFSTIKEIRDHILLYSGEKTVINRDATKVSDINFNTKMWAFRKEFMNKYKIDFYCWDNIRKVRNELSHRAPEKVELEVDEYRKELQRSGLILCDNGEVNWKAVYRKIFPQDSSTKQDWEKLKEDDRTRKYYNTQEYKDYSLKLWYQSSPFGLVIGCLSKLSLAVSSQLSAKFNS